MNKRLLAALLCAALLLAGCKTPPPAATPVPSIAPQSTQRPVSPSPTASASKGLMPSIPASIAQGENTEPQLSVYVVQDDQIVEQPLEEYITAVVAGEMKKEWPAAALEAQAIIARTFVLQFIAEKGGSQYGNADVSTDIKEAQAYNPENINDAIQQAIQNTRGQVMVYEGEFVRGWFHAHAAGVTAYAKEGLAYDGEEPPYIIVTASPDSPDAPKEEVEWTVRIPLEKALTAAREVSGNDELTSLEGLTIGETGPSGRAVTFTTTAGDSFSAPAFRMALGSTEFKSTLIKSMRLEGDALVVSGLGYGHGVGMSQWGAYQMAKDGKSAQDILAYYFKDVQFET